MDWNYEEGERGGGKERSRCQAHTSHVAVVDLPPLSLQPSMPCFSLLCQGVSSVSQHGVTASHMPAFPPPLILQINLMMTICGSMRQCTNLMRYTKKTLSKNSGLQENWHETGAHCKVTMTQQLCLQERFVSKDTHFSFWYIGCHISGVKYSSPFMQLSCLGLDLSTHNTYNLLTHNTYNMEYDRVS